MFGTQRSHPQAPNGSAAPRCSQPETASQFLRVQVGDYRPNPPPPPTIMVVSEIDPHTQNRYDHGVSSLDVKERTVTVKRPVGFE